MNLTTLFIKRPVMTTLIMVGILVFGITAYKQLAVSDLPNVDFPTITVTALLPGTSPQTMAATVATPLEEILFDDRWNRQHDVDVELGPNPDRRAVQPGPEHRRGSPGHPGRGSRKTLRTLPQGILPPSYQKT